MSEAATGGETTSTTAAAATTTTATTTATSSTTSRPVHPAVLTTFGPGKGSGASEFSVWAYLTRPRPAATTTSATDENNNNIDGNNGKAPLPNLVTAHANSLRVYTVLPHAGTLALTAVYDNLAGTICSLDVIPNGMGGGCCIGCGAISVSDDVDGDAATADDNDGGGGGGKEVDDDDEEILFYNTNDNNNSSNNKKGKRKGCTCSYDGLLIGFAGHPRLSLVYPSTPMVGGGCWNKSTIDGENSGKNADEATGRNAANDTTKTGQGSEDNVINMGVGQGGVLLASSIIDLSPALVERSMGGMSYLEQDIIVSVNTSGTVTGGVELGNKRQQDSRSENDPCVSVVLGGGVAIASFSLPKGSRPDEESSSTSSSSWWRIASEPYILPLPTLSSKIRFDFGGGGGSLGANALTSASNAAAAVGRGAKNQPAAGATVGGGPLLGHGFGDILDISFLSGYTEPTLVVLHSNPKRGGGRAWAGRLGRTAEIPVTTEEDDEKAGGDDYGEDMDLDDGKAKIPETVGTGTKFGLSLTAISISIHQRRSVVLWSLLDTIPADAWNLVPHPTNGVLVMGVNTIVYVSMGGKIQSALAVNGFARIGCPTALLPPTLSAKLKSRNRSSNSTAVCLEPNPSPLPKLALQLDGARVGFLSEDVALICLGNGTLHSLELHRPRGTSTSTLISLSPLGHRVGGLGVASCLSVMAMACHSNSLMRYLSKDDDAAGMGVKKDTDGKVKNDPKADEETSSSRGPSGPQILSKGIVFVGSRMGDCSLLAFSMNEPIRLTVTDVDKESGSGFKRKLEGARPDTSSSLSEPSRKQSKLEDAEVVEDGSSTEGDQSALSNEEILRLEEEELYRMDDNDGAIDKTAPSLVSPRREESGEEDEEEESTSKNISFQRRAARYLSTFRKIRALDSLTGLGPLGKGVYGPVATCPSLTGQDSAITPSSAAEAHVSLFSNAFASAARHYIMPCGFGDSGGLAVLTTPGRDNVGGSILCEADLCNMAGSMFGLPQSNLVLLGKSDGVGSIVLRGIVRTEVDENDKMQHNVEEFEEVDVAETPEMAEDSMDVDEKPSLHNAADVFKKTTLLSASEFGARSSTVKSAVQTSYFCIFFVKAPHLENDPYSIVIMSKCDDDAGSERGTGLQVDFVHSIESNSANTFFNETNPRGGLSSVTPFISKISEDGSIVSVAFGCVWASGHASVYTISLAQIETSKPKFEVSETVFCGSQPSASSNNGNDEEVDFYNSGKVVSMDILSLPHHIFEKTGTSNAEEIILPPPEPSSSSLSFLPDRLSMHGTWFAQGSSNSDDPPRSQVSENKILIAICRRSGVLEVYDNGDTLSSPIIHDPSTARSLVEEFEVQPLWHAQGCGHGVSVLGQSSPGVKVRRPEMHDVEVAEIRFFVSGPSLKPDTLSEDSLAEEKDAWMLRSLCILVDTTLGDLHMYSGSKRRSNQNQLEFSRVPLSNVSRPSDEAGRHFIKLRRKGIVSSLSQESFRPNRLHRFCDISGQDGLFAATPRPLWFVSERGAPTIVSHKSRHVSPAGGRSVPVSGFCTSMPAAFKNASKGFITLHERIGRVGSQRLTLYSGLSDVFAPHGLLPGGGISIQKIPLGVTVRHIEFIDDASISTTARPMYVLVVSREVEADQSYLNDDGLSPEERQQIRDEKERAQTQKQVEADLGGFDMEQEWVEEIEREDCFEIDLELGSAPPILQRKYEVWLVDASSQWKVVSKHELGEYEHGTALSVLYLTDVVEDSDETPRKSLFIAVGTSLIEPDGEDIASQGRILLFQVKKKKHWTPSKGKMHPPLEMSLKSEKDITLGPITSLASLKSEDIYRIVVGAGAEVTIEQWGSGKLTQVGFYHAHMQVQEIILFKTFFLLSDAYDSLHFLVWRESDKSLTLLAKDYEPTQVFAAGLISRGGAMAFVCHDDRQNLQFFQYAPNDAAARGGNKLVCRADYHLGSQTTALRSHWGQSSLLFNSCTMSSTLAALKQQDALFGRLEDDQRFAVNFGTTDGSFGSIVPLSEPTYWRLTALQSVMSNALESNCALSHRSWRLYRRSTRRGGCRNNDRKKGVVDADLVAKFVDLPLAEQEDLASSIGSTVALVMDNLLELGCAGSAI